VDCEVGECDEKARKRGLCERHYRRLRLYGDPLGSPPPRPKPSPEDRFWGKVDKNGPISGVRPDLGQCWIFAGSPAHRYGRFYIGEPSYAAHRLSYEWLVGPIPEGHEIDHLCKVTKCVNPDHLEAVTHHENILRGESPSARAARQTHCKNGHEFTPENIIPTWDGGRRCKTCSDVYQYGYNEARKAAAKEMGNGEL
jgi:hypothetical protein